MGPLRRQQVTEDLPPKVLAVLWLLANNSGRVVSKTTLLDTVWANTFVSEGTLATCLSRLRDALGEDSQHPRFIATVHRLGYRFVAPVIRGSLTTVSPRSPLLPSAASPVRGRLLVGREHELAQLHAAFQAAQEGDRQTVVIAGEMGMGKTALLHRFLEQFGEPSSVLVGYGQCVEHNGQAEACLPLLEALNQLSRTSESHTLVDCLRRYAPTWLERLPALMSEPQAAVRATTPAPTARRLAEALEALSLNHTVVLALEDLQWCDPSTADVLAILARRRDPAHLLIVGTCRPADVCLTNHPLTVVRRESLSRGQCYELPLQCLHKEDISSYVESLGVPEERRRELAGLLFGRTEGHPLFLTQLADHLAQQDRLLAGNPNTPHPAFDRTLPRNLRLVLDEHLSRLDPVERQILEAGSVAGLTFVAASVAAMLDLPLPLVETVCERLARQGRFLEDHGPAEWMNEAVSTCYGWRHLLYREVMFQRIGSGRLARLRQMPAVREAAAGLRCG
jgi:DNA-binding winged helix-turn-helix (wHTH) protein